MLSTAGLRTLVHAFWVGTSDGIQGERLGSIKSRLVAHYIGMHGPAGTAEIFYFCRRPAKIHCNPALSFYRANRGRAGNPLSPGADADRDRCVRASPPGLGHLVSRLAPGAKACGVESIDHQARLPRESTGQ